FGNGRSQTEFGNEVRPRDEGERGENISRRHCLGNSIISPPSFCVDVASFFAGGGAGFFFVLGSFFVCSALTTRTSPKETVSLGLTLKSFAVASNLEMG